MSHWVINIIAALVVSKGRGDSGSIDSTISKVPARVRQQVGAAALGWLAVANRSHSPAINTTKT